MARALSSSLLLALIALLGVGLVQVYSSSYMFATESYGDGLYFFKRQLVFTVLGVFTLFATLAIPIKWVEKYGWIMWPLATVLLVATFIPGLGVRVGGALRWLQLPLGIRFEPSELLKISFVLLVASLVNRRANVLSRVPWWVLTAAFLFPFFVLHKQPDFGSFAIMASVGLGLLFVFGLKWKWIAATVATAIPAFYFMVMMVPYRRARVLAFLDPWADPEQKGFQAIQSMLSFHSGGLSGVGLGQGQGKLFFLPEAHTDFTLAVFGEELGLLGFAVLLALYGFIVFRCVQIALRTESNFKKTCVLGFTMVFAFSIFINAGVVMGLLPTKGLTLPFLSYGGSSLVILCFMFGLILSIENSLDQEPVLGTLNRRKK